MSTDDYPIVTYPYDGQTGVPLKFTGNERPNPLVKFGVKETGYVISTTYKGFALDSKITVTDSKGRSIPHLSDIDSFIFIYTKEPLKYDETYTVTVEYTSLMSDK